MSTSTSAGQRWTLQSRAMASAAVLSPSVIRFKAREAVRPPQNSDERDRTRRLLNIVVAAMSIVLAAPLMLLIGILIRLTSRGPVVYTQPRVGVDRRISRGPEALNHRRKVDQGGRIFTIYKFRTMQVDRAPARQVWASNRDPRITPVGHILRKFRIDEIPQLFNVLKGDMNIVGPRPEQPEIFHDLREEFGHYRDRQRVLPGITGLAQVTLPYDQSLDDVRKKVALDLEYIRRRSATGDLFIMAKTMPVMALRKGAR